MMDLSSTIPLTNILGFRRLSKVARIPIMTGIFGAILLMVMNRRIGARGFWRLRLDVCVPEVGQYYLHLLWSNSLI